MGALPLMRRALTTITLAAIVASTSTLASAHEFPQERSVIVQMHDDRVELLLVHKEPAGERADLFMMRVDLDKDGKISSAEAKQAGGFWLPYALSGLSFEVPNNTPRAREPELKFQRLENGDIAMAALLTYDLDETSKPSRSFRVMLSRGDATIPTTTSFQGTGWDVVALADRALSDTSRPVAAKLHAGQELTATFERATARKKTK